MTLRLSPSCDVEDAFLCNFLSSSFSILVPRSLSFSSFAFPHRFLSCTPLTSTHPVPPNSDWNLFRPSLFHHSLSVIRIFSTSVPKLQTSSFPITYTTPSPLSHPLHLSYWNWHGLFKLFFVPFNLQKRNEGDATGGEVTTEWKRRGMNGWRGRYPTLSWNTRYEATQGCRL